jgi:outer membrane protein TolC
MAMEARPEVRKNDFARQRESYRKTAGYLSYLPDFDIGAARHSITGEKDTWDVTFSVALPLFFWQPAVGEVSEAEASLAALREERTHLANAIALEVEEAWVGLTSAADQIRIFEEDILVQAEEAYEMYEFSYQQGEITALDLIEARRTLNDARMSYADALYSYDLATAGMERSIGRPPQEQRNERGVFDPEPGLRGDPDSVPGGVQERLRLRRRHRGGRAGG